jgi:glycosyltransferase involved in cell wall biosynthesis
MAMMESAVVSVIMPVYKVEKYISDSIQSVLRQTYKNIELIIVDDGSPDRSVDIAKQLLASSKMRYQIIRQENAGQGYARNTGMAAATGAWILFLDSDDLISDNAIEHLVSAGETQKADLVFSDYIEITQAEEAIHSCKKGEQLTVSSENIQQAFLKRNNVVLAPGTLYRKQMLDDNGLKFEKIPWSEDQHFVWRVLYCIDKAVYVKEPLYQYLRHSGSIMSATKIDAMIKSYPAICELESYYGKNTQTGSFIVSRWVMGTLNSAAVMVEYTLWRKLAKTINMKKHFFRLLKFPDIRVRILALLGLGAPKRYFVLNRKRKS